MDYLRLDNVDKHFLAHGTVIPALRGVDLAVEQGEFVVILGPSGCGKTTLLHLVAGLEAPSSGQITLSGVPITHWSGERTLIFQRPNLFPWLTAEGNVAFGLRMAGLPASQRQQIAGHALERMGLAQAASLYPHQLSGGMQQRVALARALVLDPAVLLMDEPLASVDSLLRSRLQAEIRNSCRGKTVLFVTHSIREALALADRLVILSPQPGRVLRQISLDGAAPRPLTSQLARLEGEIEAELLALAE